MAGALAADLMRIPGARVTALRDPRVVQLALHGCEIIDVQSAAEHLDEFERLAAAADATFLIAPEFDGILFKAARACGRVRRPAAFAVAGVHPARGRQARDVRTAGGGRRAGAARHLAGTGAKAAGDFSYPAVLKPVDGAGSQDTLLVAGPHDEPPPYAWPRRLERYMTGPGGECGVSLWAGGTRAARAVQAADLGGRPAALSRWRVAACRLGLPNGRSRSPSEPLRRCPPRWVTWASIWCSGAIRTVRRIS